MKKWRISSIQSFPSKGMEKYQSLNQKDSDENIVSGRIDYADCPQDSEAFFEQGLSESIKSMLYDKKKITDDFEEEEEQDYTLNDDLSDMDSEFAVVLS